MSKLCKQVLPFRNPKYLETLYEKMRAEGIVAPADLLRASKEALETKLATHAAFDFIEMADAISLRSAMDRTAAKPRSCSPQSRARSRSRGRPKGRRNKSRPHRGDNYGPPPREPRERKSKPELWAAAERNDDVKVQELLSLG